MEVFNWKYKTGNKPLEIVALGDIHLGSPQSDVIELKKTIAKIKKRKAKVILLGDLIDMGLRDSPGPSVFEHNLTPKEQVKEIINILQPIKNQILSTVIGNHCYRINKSCGLDIMEQIAATLECNYGKYQCINTIQLKNQKYNIFSTHGSVSAMTTEGRVNGFKRYLEQIEADIYLFGHTHDKHHRIFSTRSVHKKSVIEILKHMILCGNYLQYKDSYGEYRGFPPLKIGCPLIKLYPNTHKIEVELEW